MSSDLCYKNVQLIPQWLFAANDASLPAPKMDQRKYFCDSTIFHVEFHTATINDTSGCVAFGPNTNHELRLFLSMHKQNIRLAAWEGGQCDGEQRKWTQMLIAILKWRSINLTVESKWLYCPKLLWFVCLMFLSWSMKKNYLNQAKKNMKLKI